jgi:hypothetical protein
LHHQDAGRATSAIPGKDPWGGPGYSTEGRTQEVNMNLLLLVVVLLLIVGALPTWPYSTGWGYYPSGGLSLLLLVLIIMALTRTAP